MPKLRPRRALQLSADDLAAMWLGPGADFSAAEIEAYGATVGAEHFARWKAVRRRSIELREARPKLSLIQARNLAEAELKKEGKR